MTANDPNPYPRLGPLQTLILIAVGLLIAAGMVILLDDRGGDSPRLVFLLRDEQRREDLWLADPQQPERMRRLTHIDGVIVDFDTGDDGQTLVYSMVDLSNGYADLYLFDIESGESTRLTHCAAERVDCSAPAYRADGRFIAYQQGIPSANPDMLASRIWILDLRADPPATYPLIEDADATGHSPIWSPDGGRLAFYDDANEGIVVMDFDTRADPAGPQVEFLASAAGLTGAFSPDGSKLVYPEILFEETGPVKSHLQIADLERGYSLVLSNPNDITQDQRPAWSPDGRMVAFGRSYVPGYGDRTQVYIWDTGGDSVSPLLLDAQYNQGFLRWSPDSQYLSMNRLRVLDNRGQPEERPALEVWVYHMGSDTLVKLADDARMPQWIP